MSFWGTLGSIGAAINPFAAMGAIGSVAGSYLGYKGQEDANETNLQIAREGTAANMAMAQGQMNFQERMSNTAYQRSRADMEKAGINPMLMTSQGGASSPGGASGSALNTRVESSIAPAVANAKDMLMTLAQVEKLRADTKVSDSQAIINGVAAQKVVQDTKTSGATAKNLEAQNDFIRANAKMTENNQWRSDRLNEGFENVLNFINRVSGMSPFSAKNQDGENPYRMDRYLPRRNAEVQPRSGGKER